MKRYNEYKYSGIEWLGEIPEHWEVKRIKDIFKELGSGTTPKSSNLAYYDNGNINWLNTTDLKNNIIYDTKIKITQKALDEVGLKMYPIDSLAIAMYGQGKTRGSVGLLKVPTTTNQAACIMSKPKNVDTKYMLYWFISKYEDIRKINIGATQPNMNQDFVKYLFLQKPTLNEQTQIANYLDAKTTAIDKKINLLQQKTTHYKAYRKTLINEAVTKGLNKNVKLKNSGISLIGQIPELWVIQRIKDVFIISRGRAIAKTELKTKGKYPVYSSQTKNNGVLGYINTFDFNANLLTWTTDGVNAGTVFIREGKFNCTNICGTLIPKKNPKLSLEYMAYAVQESTQHNKRIDTNGAKIMSNEMAVINIVFPPFEEQVEIANYINKKAISIDKIVENIKTQITTLKEFRKTLINEVVTGKVKVNNE